MTSHVPHRTAENVVRILEHHGFLLIGQRGSHQKWRSCVIFKECRQVIVPYHMGRDLPTGTMKSIIDGSGLAFEDFTAT
ncbi:putative RNA binding protein YcfA, dsRBD-like fold, HicA-like mRNA interferase family [Dehalogenimonas formicexedens]|uniref:Putative RNA binding protein YcfA, dsRBD-like fold, HicA-like mRNA interferase family n=1 Tax=Dehalogenimonas formicexedens TaxID=1839801 RepID=A0A1P8F625_9CHLR|nr:type II toxin-antitoxin system HicA family toxin [Dehalogenimonas formicexedens]APV43936.1 putative RNA binding protein YcfA, dsRBD-like fold, HicA-like mRNA interferase family [Dehalogenimonas formicexedens]